MSDVIPVTMRMTCIAGNVVLGLSISTDSHGIFAIGVWLLASDLRNMDSSSE